jgi:hypothetical protein
MELSPPSIIIRSEVKAYIYEIQYWAHRYCATVTNQNFIQEEIKRRFNLGNACYNSVQNLLSSRLLPKNVKIIIYRTIILPVILHGCET